MKKRLGVGGRFAGKLLHRNVPPVLIDDEPGVCETVAHAVGDREWTGRLKSVETFNRETCVLVRAYLEAHRDEVRVANLDLAAFVCVTSVEALTHAAVLRRPEVFAAGETESFIDEVTRLVVRYLRSLRLQGPP